MIHYIVGVPGSGKTYKAVYTLYANFAKNKDIVKSKKYKLKNIEKTYTNINELDLTKFNNVSSFKFDDFYTSLQSLFLLKDELNDTELNKKAVEFGISNTLIILDECHNFLDKQDKVLIWWLSYHRHLHQEIYLLTQNLSLVNNKYKNFSEFFYKAIPSSLKLFNSSMKYTVYTNSRMSFNLKSGVDKIPINKEVFLSYGSGANQKSSSIILKYLMIFVFLLSLSIFILYILKESFMPDKEIKKEDSGTKEEIKISKEKTKKETRILKNYNSLKKLKYMKLTCSIKNKFCLYKNHKINLNFYLEMKKIIEIKEISSFQIDKKYIQLEIFADDIFYFIYNKRGKKNEKGNNSNSSQSSFIF